MFGNSKLILTYIANSGVSIQYKDKKILIDAVHTADTPPYQPVSEAVYEKMVFNEAPYHNIDMMFFTHHHDDHFDAEAVNEILKRNKHAHLVGTEMVMSFLRQCKNFNEILETQMWQMTLARYKSIQITLKDVPIEIFSVAHDGEMYAGIDNYVYLFELKNRVFMHVGDAQATEENFMQAGLFTRPVDFMIVPFPFIGLSTGRKIISRFKPQKVFVTHLPQKSYDEANLIYKTYKAYKKHQPQLPATEILETPGKQYTL